MENVVFNNIVYSIYSIEVLYEVDNDVVVNFLVNLIDELDEVIDNHGNDVDKGNFKDIVNSILFYNFYGDHDFYMNHIFN